MEKRKPSCTVGGDANCYNHHGEQYEDSFKNLKFNYIDPAITLLGIYPEETRIEKDTCTITITRTWKQCRSPSADDKEVVVYIHNGILLSHKKECLSVSSNEVDEPRAY